MMIECPCSKHNLAILDALMVKFYLKMDNARFDHRPYLLLEALNQNLCRNKKGFFFDFIDSSNIIFVNNCFLIGIAWKKYI